MADADRMEELELQVKELSRKLEAVAGIRRQVADLTDEEVETYRKVRDLVTADFGEFCGINDCFRCIMICRVCQVCAVCRVCAACIFECSCGPCGTGPTFPGTGVGRFGGLGG